MSLLKDLNSRPDKNKDRVGWNKSWETDLKWHYEAMDRFGSPGFSAIDTMSISLASIPQELIVSMRPHLVLHADRIDRDICAFQKDLVAMALERMAHDDFEKKWKGLTQKRREELVLEGLYKTCVTGPKDMEISRTWCPDMTVENLAGNGGQVYIDLLTKIIPEDMEITEPV